ncbi:MAG: D-alanine--D-alanine ligase family protein [Corynebacterium sp.]|nr:D-alanine--D-alanine ligase family protein [Corynebacterium sp.]
MTALTRVAVLYGGQSTEHSVSCISAGAVMAHLDPQRFDVVPIGITPDGVWTPGVRDGLKIVDGVLPEVKGEKELALSLNPAKRGHIYDVETGELFAQVDVVFPVLHGQCGEDGTVQGLLELAGMPYVGTGVLSSAVSMDKEYMRKLIAAESLPVTRDIVLHEQRELTDEEKDYLGLPVFVKPARGGSSIGVSKVTQWSDFAQAVAVAGESDTKIMVEAEVVGPEVEIGVLQLPDGTLIASVPAQLEGTEEGSEGFYDFEAKYLEDVVSATIPAPLSDDNIALLKDIAIKTFRALNCEGLSRVDFFMTDNGPVINEINTLPGFTPISMYPQVFAASGIAYADLLTILIDTALQRTRL